MVGGFPIISRDRQPVRIKMPEKHRKEFMNNQIRIA